MRRTRLFDAEGDDIDFAAYIRAHPEEPMPALVILARHIGDGHSPRMEAILAMGRRLGVGAVVVDPWPTSRPSRPGRTAGS